MSKLGRIEPTHIPMAAMSERWMDPCTLVAAAISSPPSFHFLSGFKRTQYRAPQVGGVGSLFCCDIEHKE